MLLKAWPQGFLFQEKSWQADGKDLKTSRIIKAHVVLHIQYLM